MICYSPKIFCLDHWLN